MTDKSPDNHIEIKCQKERDGLTIRINTPTLEALALIKNVFTDLSEEKIEEFELLQLESVISRDIKSLKLRLTRKDIVYKAVRLIKNSADGPEFHWMCSAEGWADCAWLLNGFQENSGQPGHQYFDYTSIDNDATIVVAFREG